MAPFSFVARLLLGAGALVARGVVLVLFYRDHEADRRQDRIRQSGGWGL